MDLQQACDVIERDRAAAEERSRMTPAVRDAATEAGLWVLAAPREVGGREQTLIELATTFEQLGHADPAFSWIAMNSLATGHIGAKLSDAARGDLFASHAAPYGYGGAPTYSQARRADGGWLVDGDWRFMTGSSDADWCTIFTMLPDSAD